MQADSQFYGFSEIWTLDWIFLCLCYHPNSTLSDHQQLPFPSQAHRMLRNASKGVVRKAVTELAQYPKPGEKIHGFTLLRSKHVPELELTALHLQHDKTGADYLHVAREDKNNVFSIGFKTNPPDHTGVPHILEHTTLCGSEK